MGGRTRTSGQGRPKGVPNKATLTRQAEIAASGLTPLEFMLSILRDENKDEALRADMAKAAAPYVHPRLTSIEAKVSGSLDIRAKLLEMK